MTGQVFSSHIAEILKRKDQVSIKGIGTLSTTYLPSRYDEKNDRFLPPSKSVLFDSLIIEDHQLIAHLIAQKTGQELHTVNAEISEVVAEWTRQLENGTRILIGEIGYLFKNEFGKTSFKQEGFHALLSESFGLKPISFITKETFIHVEEVLFEPQQIHSEQVELPKKDLSFELEKPERIEKENRPSISLKENVQIDQKVQSKGSFNKRHLLWLALIPIAFYAYWIPVKTSFLDTGDIQLAELNPLRTSPDASYIPEGIQIEHDIKEELSLEEQIRMLPPEVETFNMSLDGELFIPVRLDKRDNNGSNLDIQNDTEEAVQVLEDHTETPSNPTKINPISTGMNYHLIGGCFSDKSNADAFVEKMKSSGLPAFILDHHKGLHRVSIGQYGNRENAKEALKEYRSTGESAWVLKM